MSNLRRIMPEKVSYFQPPPEFVPSMITQLRPAECQVMDRIVDYLDKIKIRKHPNMLDDENFHKILNIANVYSENKEYAEGREDDTEYKIEKFCIYIRSLENTLEEIVRKDNDNYNSCNLL